MFDFDRVQKVLFEELGECGAEAFTSAIEFYLGQAPDSWFDCEEDKLVLLMYLYSLHSSLILPQFNPLYHFTIKFDCLDYAKNKEC